MSATNVQVTGKSEITNETITNESDHQLEKDKSESTTPPKRKRRRRMKK
jgi:hypothetical protein